MLTAYTQPLSCPEQTAESLGRIAILALYYELALAPKPGLVSPVDSGSHRDMDVNTFMRSLFSLRGYFRDIALAGCHGANFPELRQLGMLAEQRMLVATNGVNTHRGAIFSLGLLVAAAGLMLTRGHSIVGRRLGETVACIWGQDIADATPGVNDKSSHGMRAVKHYGVGGARGEAIEGFPALFDIGLPTLSKLMTETGDMRRSMVQTLFCLIRRLQDTNLLYRGGSRGLHTAQSAADAFIDAGGVHQCDWATQVLLVRREFVALNLSPGGSADLLSASWFVYHAQKALA